MFKIVGFTALLAIATTIAIGSGSRSAEASVSATIEVNDVVLRANVDFRPVQLPRRSFAPAVIRAGASFTARGDGLSQALERMRISLGGRHVRINARGMPVCRVERLAGTTTGQARARCAGSLVAVGRAAGAAEQPGRATVRGTAPLLVFNGPPRQGRPTLIAHVYTLFPAPETIIAETPLLVNRRGIGGFSMDLEIPRFADGFGYLTGISARIGRSFKRRGRNFSYVSARCPVTMLPAYGLFTFADNTIIEGTINDFCAFRR